MFYNGDNSIGVAIFKDFLSCRFCSTPQAQISFCEPAVEGSSPASPLNRPSQQVFELQLIDHVVIGSPAPGAEQLLQLERGRRHFLKAFRKQRSIGPEFCFESVVREGTRILCILLSNGNIGMDQPSNFPREAGIQTIQRKPPG
jgi:hypothetical protein